MSYIKLAGHLAFAGAAFGLGFSIVFFLAAAVVIEWFV